MILDERHRQAAGADSSDRDTSATGHAQELGPLSSPDTDPDTDRVLSRTHALEGAA